MSVNTLSVEAAYAAWASDLVRYASALVAPSVAGDVVADTFAQLLTTGQDGWRQARDPRGYLFGAVAKTARMQHRSDARRDHRQHRHVALQTGPTAAMPADDGLGHLNDLLDELSPGQREVVSLTYWEDLAPAEVARILDVSEGTVRKQLARARAQLRKVLS